MQGTSTGAENTTELEGEEYVKECFDLINPYMKANWKNSGSTVGLVSNDLLLAGVLIA